MALEVYRGPEKSGAVPPGKVSIAVTGQARFSAADLAAAGIDRTVTLLIDHDEHRIGVRAPRKGEPIRSVTKTNGPALVIGLGGALLELGIRPATVAGRRQVVIDEGLVLISFAKA